MSDARERELIDAEERAGERGYAAMAAILIGMLIIVATLIPDAFAGPFVVAAFILGPACMIPYAIRCYRTNRYRVSKRKTPAPAEAETGVKGGR